MVYFLRIAKNKITSFAGGITLLLGIFNSAGIAGQCSALFSFNAYFEKVTFINQSNGPNIRYYWNFGDGTSSHLKNPTHEFVENGNYQVTLYTLDTITQCPSFYDTWLNITKYSSDPCVPFIIDSVYSFNSSYDYVKIKENSTNCGTYNASYSIGWYSKAQPDIVKLAKDPCGMVAAALYSNGSALQRAAYRTINKDTIIQRITIVVLRISNFRFVSQDIYGQRIFFKAMNKGASVYR